MESGEKERWARGPPPPTVCCPQCHTSLFQPRLSTPPCIALSVYTEANRKASLYPCTATENNEIERHNAAWVKQSAEAFKLPPIPLTNLMGRLWITQGPLISLLSFLFLSSSFHISSLLFTSLFSCPLLETYQTLNIQFSILNMYYLLNINIHKKLFIYMKVIF